MKRLVDDSIAPELHDLLRSAEGDAPPAPEDRQDKIIAAIAASTAGGAATAAVTAAASTRLDGLVRFAKWAAPLFGVVVAASYVGVREPADRAQPVEPGGTPAPAVEQVQRPPEAEPPPTATREEGVRVEDLPSAAASAQRPAARADGDVPRPPSPAAARPLPAPEPNIDAEIAAIDKARGALAGERPAEALGRVEAYRSTFADPHFADEADAIEVQALAALGRKDEARGKAERFLATRARSPYAQRVRSAAGLK